MAAPCKHASLPTPSVQVVFVLDDLERFTKQRGRQTLLYNMLDELQHSNVQVGSSMILKGGPWPPIQLFCGNEKSTDACAAEKRVGRAVHAGWFQVLSQACR